MKDDDKTREQLIRELIKLRRRIAALENAEVGHKKVYEALKKAEREKAAILDSMSEIVTYRDAEMRVLWANRASGGLAGLEPEQLVGRYCYDIYHQRSEPCADCPIVKAGQTGQPQEAEVTDPDGREWFIRGYPVRDANGRITGIVEVTLEITERKLAEKTLRENEEKLDSMLRSIGDHMRMMDKDLNIIWANETARKIFGNDIIKKKCYEICHCRKEPCEPHCCITLQAFEDGKVHERDTQVIDRDGKKIYFNCITNVALKDNEGKPAAVIVISRDITSMKQAEKELRESEERFRRIVETSQEGIWLIGANAKTEYVNKQMAEMLGYTTEEMLGRSFFDFMDDKARLEAEQYFKRRKQGIKEIHDFRFCRKYGPDIWTIISTNPMFNDKGEFTGVLGMITDITSRKQTEEALKKKERELMQQARHLEEVNTALKVLINHREEEKEKLGESILMNVRKLVLPYIEKLDKGRMRGESKTYLSIIKSNLENLVSPFANRLSSKALNLTPAEIQVADLVKHGQTSKEIASILNVSPNAVMFHRKNIRKKLGLSNKKTNLRTHLQSLTI